MKDSVVSGDDRLTVYENTGALRGSAKNLEESSGFRAEGGLHTSVEEVGAIVGRAVRAPNAPAGARGDVVVGEEGGAVGVSKVIVNTTDSEELVVGVVVDKEGRDSRVSEVVVLRGELTVGFDKLVVAWADAAVEEARK